MLYSSNIVQIVQIIFLNNMAFICWESTYLVLLNISFQQDTETACYRLISQIINIEG